MRLRRVLGIINGTVVGGVIGLAVLSELGGGLSASIPVAAFGGAVAASIPTGFKPIPGSFGGLAGGLVGVGIAYFPVPLLAIPVPGLSTYAIGGAVGGVVALALPWLR